MMTMPKQLRALADWYEDNPAMKDVAIGFMSSFSTITVYICDTRESAADFIAALDGGRCKKRYGDAIVYLDGKANDLAITGVAGREAVCRRVQVEKIMPAEPAQIIEARPERTVTVTEWECSDPSLEASGARRAANALD